MFWITCLPETALTLYYSLFICASESYSNNNYKNIKQDSYWSVILWQTMPTLNVAVNKIE